MKNETKNNQTASAVIIHADKSDFRVGVRNCGEKLANAVKPITDIWYPRFVRAAEAGADDVIEVWGEYRREYFKTLEHPEDEIFRFAALVMIVQGVQTYYWGDEKSDFRYRYSTYKLLDLIRDQEISLAEHYFPRVRFAEDRRVYDVALSFNDLDYFYQNA